MKFAEFDVDPDAGVLRRDGARVKLQDLPFRMLVILLRRAGAVVTRDELRAELWGAETFVDAEAGLNTALAKLREALGDDAGAPKFIETLPKRGYRFIGTIVPDAPPAEATPAGATGGPRAARFWIPAIALAVIVLAFAGNPRYAVIGNSPLLRTERIFQDVRKIGEALHAEYVVLGQLQNTDGGLVTRAHFIRVGDQTHLWAGKIDLAGVPDTERAVTTVVADGIVAGLKRR